LSEDEVALAHRQRAHQVGERANEFVGPEPQHIHLHQTEKKNTKKKEKKKRQAIKTK
jgi:hypothetical protein